VRRRCEEKSVRGVKRRASRVKRRARRVREKSERE
jgi:hypothetical protein